MKAKALMVTVVIVAVAIIFWEKQQIASLQQANVALIQAAAEATAEADRVVAAAKPDPAEVERIKSERAELLKLRGEVVTLRKEKEAWERQAAADKKAAAQTAANAARAAQEAQQRNQQMQANVAQTLEQILNAPSGVKGSESGNLRRKLLNREPLNETEQALLQTMMSKTGEIEKNPQEFASFQSAYIGSVLGWNSNDPRAQQVQAMLTRAAGVATERGFDYHAPGENANNWNDQQKALNARATGAVQNMLSPEERAVFDKAFIGVLGVDLGVGPAQRK